MVLIGIALVVIVALWVLVISPLMSKREFWPHFKNWLLEDEINDTLASSVQVTSPVSGNSVTNSQDGTVTLQAKGKSTIKAPASKPKNNATKAKTVKVQKPATVGKVTPKAAKAAVKAVMSEKAKKTVAKTTATTKAKAAPKAAKAKSKTQK